MISWFARSNRVKSLLHFLEITVRSLRNSKQLILFCIVLLAGISSLFLSLFFDVKEISFALRTFFAFSLFLLPGAALSFWILPEEGLLERWVTSFVLSIGIMILPGILVLSLHLSLNWFIAAFQFASILGSFILIILFRRHSIGWANFEPFEGPSHLHLVIITIILAIVLCVISYQIPLIGDDWAAMPFLQNFMVAEHVNQVEPFHGTDLPTTSRSELSVWGLDFALFSRLSGLNPLIQYRYLRSLLTLTALLAFYILSKKVTSSRNAAAFVTSFWMVTLLATISWGDTGYDLVARINQDKFVLRYIMLPVALYFLLRYFGNYKLGDLLCFGLVSWAVGGTHPIGPVLIGLPCLGFGLIHLAVEKRNTNLKQIVLAVAFLGTGLILPTIQLLGVEEGWLAFELTGTKDPNLLTRLGMATRAQRLWLLPNGNYALHPGAILEPLNLIALLGLPFLIWRARNHLSARLLLGSFLIVPFLLYFPPSSSFIGRLITPWLLYRLIWPIPLVAVLTIGWCLWTTIYNLRKLKFSTKLFRIQSYSPMVILFLLTAILTPSIRRGLVYLEELNLNPNNAQCEDPAPLLNQLPEILNTDSIFLADHDLNFCIPAFSPHAKVLEYRWTTTLSRFPPYRRDEALQRVKDMLYFSSAWFVDTELSIILDRYHVRYILIEEEKPLNLQLKHMPDWFTPIVQEGRFILYAVNDNRTDLDLVNANTALILGDWDKARFLYESLVGQDSDTSNLAHLGLAELYLSQGQVDRSVEELKKSLVLSPTDGFLWGLLADTLAASGNNEEAIEAYYQAIDLAPENSQLAQHLGHVYRLTSLPEKANWAYTRAADLLAPRGSALWYQVLGNLYGQAEWYLEALEAYRQSLAILPGEVSVEIKIGDVYLNQGDPQQARLAYQRAARLDRWAVQPVIRLGILAEQEDNPTAAIHFYRQAIQLAPTGFTPYILLADTLQARDGGEAALEAIQTLPGYDLILPGPVFTSGILYASQGRFDQAVSEYEKAIDRFPLDTTSVQIAMALLRSKEGERELAKNMLYQALAFDPKIAVQANIHLGEVYGEEAKFAQAIGAYYKAVRADIISTDAYMALGDVYANLAQNEKSISEYLHVVAVHPRYSGSYIALGDTYLMQGNLDQAEHHYLQAINLNPEQANGYLGLAQVYMKQGRITDAIRTYREAEKISKDARIIQVALAQALKITGEVEEALAQQRLAVQTDPTNFRALRNLGFFLVGQREAHAAMDTFRSAIEAQPKDERNRIGLAKVLLTTGAYEEAFQQLQIAAEIGNRKSNTYIALGEEFERRGEWEQAISTYKLSINAEPTLVDGYLHLGSLFETLGDRESALVQYRSAANAVPSSGAVYTALGNILYKQGNSVDAIEALERAIEVEPNYTEAYIRLAEVSVASGRANESLALYESVLQCAPGSTEIWVAMANYHYNQGQRDEAFEALQRAVSIEPGNIQVWLELGSFYQKQGNFLEAENSFISILDLEPGNAVGYLALGDLYMVQGKSMDAQTMYEMAAEVDQSRDEAYLHIGDLHLSRGRISDAIAAFHHAIERQPGKDQGYIQLGKLYLDQGDFDQAEEQYEKAIRIVPSSSGAFLALGNLYQKRGLWDGALRYYLQAANVEPLNVLVWTMLGDFYKSRGNFDEAENSYLKAIAANKGDPAGYIGLGTLYQGLGKIDAAKDNFRSAVSAAPGSFSGHIALGKFLQSQGDWVQAEQSFREAIMMAAVPDSYLALGELFSLKADDQSAEELYRKAIQVSPVDIRAYLALGKLKEKQGNKLTSEILYKQAIGIAPSSSIGYEHLGNQYADSAEWEQALAVLKEGVIAAPGSMNAHLAMGQLYLRFQKFDKAQDHFEKAASLDRSFSDPLVSLADSYLRQGNQDKAIQILQKALEVEPTQLEVYIALGTTYWMMGDSSDAIDSFSMGIRNSLTIAEAYVARANSYSSQGDWEKARVDLENAWHLNPGSQSIGLRLAKFIASRGDFEKALAILNQLIELTNATSEAHITLGHIYAIKANWMESRAAFEKAIELGGEISDAHTGLAHLDELQGFTEEAIQHYQLAVKASPYDSQAWVNLGDAYQARLDRPNAKRAYERALEIEPQFVVAYIRLDRLTWAMEGHGIDLAPLILLDEIAPSLEIETTIAYLYQERGELDLSRSWYLRATQLDPYNCAGWLALGDYYQMLAQWDQALLAYDEALRVAPSLASTLTAIGFVQKELGHTEAALESFQKAVEAAPLAWETHYSMADILFALNRSTEAASLSSQWSTAAPGIEQEYIILGGIYAKMGEMDLALQTYQSGLELMPGSVSIYVAIGNFHRDRILEITNNLEESEDLYLWAENLVSEHQEVIDYFYSPKGRRIPQTHQEKITDLISSYLGAVSRLHSAQRDYSSISSHSDSAVAAYQRAIQLHPANSLAYMGLGQVYEATGESQDKLALYQEAVNADPHSSLALFFLGNAYLELNLPREALPWFQAALIHSPEFTPAHLGIYKASQAIETLDPFQAALSIEHGQFTWEILMDNKRTSEGN